MAPLARSARQSPVTYASGYFISPGVHRQVPSTRGSSHGNRKVTIIAENPNHTHAGKPVAKGDEIEVTSAAAQLLLRKQLIEKIPKSAQARPLPTATNKPPNQEGADMAQVETRTTTARVS